MHASIADDIRDCLRFYSRLPVGAGRDGHVMPDFSRAAWATPIAGAIIGAIGGATLLAGSLLHTPPLVSAICAIGALTLVTGALHEDGLADVADGFGGGVNREQKLAIMRDSRLGAFGAVALCIAISCRVFALAAIVEQGVFLAAFSVVASSAVSRVAGLGPLMTLLPARADGAGSAAAPPAPSAMRLALYIAAGLGLAPFFGGATLAQTVVASMAAFAAAAGVSKLAQKQIGGYTGDVLGAAQQAAEIAALVALSAR